MGASATGGGARAPDRHGGVAADGPSAPPVAPASALSKAQKTAPAETAENGFSLGKTEKRVARAQRREGGSLYERERESISHTNLPLPDRLTDDYSPSASFQNILFHRVR